MIIHIIKKQKYNDFLTLNTFINIIQRSDEEMQSRRFSRRSVPFTHP